MGIFDFIKKKKEVLQTEEKKAPKKKKAGKEKPKKPKEEKPEKRIAKEPKRKSKKGGLASVVLRSPHVTEKSTALAGKNEYVFKVSYRTNKIEVRQAVEDLYGVDVMRVNIINVSRKKRRLGRQTGWRKGYKKAIVKIKEGQKIEILPR